MNKTQRAAKANKARRDKSYREHSRTVAKAEREGQYQADRPRSSKRQWWLTVS